MEEDEILRRTKKKRIIWIFLSAVVLSATLTGLAFSLRIGGVFPKYQEQYQGEEKIDPDKMEDIQASEDLDTDQALPGMKTEEEEKEQEDSLIGDMKSLRIGQFQSIELPAFIKAGDILDIRIAFAGGEDYIVLAKKELVERSPSIDEEALKDLVCIIVSEEELLRLSSALADVRTYKDCRIYGVKYPAKGLEPSILNYPVNDVVQELIYENPNIITYAAMQMTEARQRLETIESNRKLTNLTSESEFREQEYKDYQLLE